MKNQIINAIQAQVPYWKELFSNKPSISDYEMENSDFQSFNNCFMIQEWDDYVQERLSRNNGDGGFHLPIIREQNCYSILKGCELVEFTVDVDFLYFDLIIYVFYKEENGEIKIYAISVYED